MANIRRTRQSQMINKTGLCIERNIFFIYSIHLNQKKLHLNGACSNILSKNLIEAEYLGKDEKFLSVVEGRTPGFPNASRNEQLIPIQRKHKTLWNNGLVVTKLDYLSRRSKFNISKWLRGRLSLSSFRGRSNEYHYQ